MIAREPNRPVGIIGLGAMGCGIAERFCGSRYPTHVWDLVEDRRQAFAGKAQITKPTEMAAICGVILFVVPGSEAIEAILNGPPLLLESANENLVLFDLTTSDPDHTKRLAAIAARSGIPYLDAGMTGGAMGAESGSLTLMVGGDADALHRSSGVLDICAKKIIHLGPAGSGHSMKLIHNLVTHTNFLALCEAARLADRAGINLIDLIEVLNNGNGRSFISERRFPDHILSESFDGHSAIANLHKDLLMANRLGTKLGAPLHIGRETLSYLQAAMELGYGNTDFTRIYTLFDALAAGDRAKADPPPEQD